MVTRSSAASIAWMARWRRASCSGRQTEAARSKASAEIDTALANLAPNFPDHAGKHDAYRGYFLDEDFQWNLAQDRFGSVTEKDMRVKQQQQEEQDFFTSLSNKVTEIGENLGLMTPEPVTEDDKNELELLKEDLRGGADGGTSRRPADGSRWAGPGRRAGSRSRRRSCAARARARSVASGSSPSSSTLISVRPDASSRSAHTRYAARWRSGRPDQRG